MRKRMCVWEEDEGGNWWTSCGNAFIFEDEGPVENGFRYCPYCGRLLWEQPYWEEPLEEEVVRDYMAEKISLATIIALRWVGAPEDLTHLAREARYRDLARALRSVASLADFERAWHRAIRMAYPGTSRRGAYYQRWLREVRRVGATLGLPGYLGRMENSPLYQEAL
jgi:hypothetical protein